ncbi:MAG: fold metallo-hydrolase [Deltaproteobacteria bacterium]|nr:fold metallo-hydrolase [Deltaproteobacteria bacterium]
MAIRSRKCSVWIVLLIIVFMTVLPSRLVRSADNPINSQQKYDKSKEKPFVRPGIASVFTAPENWPQNNEAVPSHRAPKGAKSFAIVLGSGTPGPNPYRMGPSFVVVSNGYPYFVDLGEGAWRSMAAASMVHGDWLARAFALDNLKYVFLTHLHCDHTVGIPSWILNGYKFGSKASKEIYGPKGTDAMMKHIMSAWQIDREDMWYGPLKADKNGVMVIAHEVDDDGLVYQDQNVKVYAYRKYHGNIKDNFAYRFECANGRIFVFAGDGWSCPGLIKACKNADVAFVEVFSKEKMFYAPWAGNDPAMIEYLTHSYHMWPEELALMQKQSGLKSLVLIHEQNYAPGDTFSRLGLLKECKRAGVKEPVFSSVDGDVY